MRKHCTTKGNELYLTDSYFVQHKEEKRVNVLVSIWKLSFHHHSHKKIKRTISDSLLLSDASGRIILSNTPY